MKIKIGYDDKDLQSINIEQSGVSMHFFIEKENIVSWIK